jgi:uncharacterized DUF497 family protein
MREVNWRTFAPSNFEYDFENDKLFQHRVTFNEAVECFFSDFEIRRNKKYRDRYQLLGTTFAGRSLRIIFQLKGEHRRSHHHRLAAMRTQKKSNSALALDQKGIDRIVVSQADDAASWDRPVKVRKSRPASPTIPGELAARAAFLAKVHREAGVDQWVERVVRERVELEELAFAEAKRKLAS